MATPKATTAEVRTAQESLVKNAVPKWEWPHDDLIAPGLRGYVEVVAQTGTVHVWTMWAEKPLSGAGARFLDSLPRDQIVRVFGVNRDSLSEAMLKRRGFVRSWKYPWSGKRQGESVSAHEYMYRQPV